MARIEKLCILTPARNKKMKLDLKTIIITASILLVGIVGGFVFQKDTPQPPEQSLGATGSRFHLQSEWLQYNTVTGLIGTTTPDFVATSSPTFLLANATTTVQINTAGVSDLRLNITVSSSSTVPILTILERFLGNTAGLTADKDVYSKGSLSSGVVTQEAPYISWSVSTTTSKDFAQTSILMLANFNVPIMYLDIGVDEASDINIEFVKAITF